MKKNNLIIMIFIIICLVSTQYAQAYSESGDPNYTILSNEKGLMYLDSLNTYWKKIQEGGKYWSYNNNMLETTPNKMSDNTTHIIVINKNVNLGEGIISQIIFYIKNNEGDTEKITFYYRHKDSKAFVIWSWSENSGIQKNHIVIKSPEYIKERIDELIKNLSLFI